jgi:hypothetical protein
MKETTTFSIFTNFLTHFVFPNFPLANPNNPNNEQHNFENKDLENDRLKG